MSDKIKHCGFYAIWILFALLLLFQHQFVYMSYDDFGYATLMYGEYQGNPNGLNWTMEDLLTFLKWQYMHWGGRVIAFFFVTLAFSCGELFMQIFQPAIILLISFFIYQLIKISERDTFSAWLIFVAYCTFSSGLISDGIFWYTASAVYVWPFVWLLGGILIWLKNPQSKKNVLAAGIMLFLSAGSHEQIAVLTIITVAIFAALKFRETKKINKTHLIILSVVLIGGAFEIFAPGNFVRANTNAEFYQSSLTDKFWYNIPIILYITFSSSNVTWIFILTLFFAGLKLFPFLEQQKNFITLTVFNIAAGIVLILSSGAVFHITYEQQGLMRVAFMLIFLVEVSLYFFKQKQYIFLSLLQGAAFSQAMMIMAPGIASRTVVPFVMVIHIIFPYIFAQTLNKKKFLFLLIIGIISISALTNAYKITNGYYQNSFVHELNRYKLQESAALLSAGKNLEVNIAGNKIDARAIVLYRLPNDTYGSCMPYQREFMTPWVKTYFGIPQDVYLIWNKFGESSDVYQSITLQAPQIENVFTGEKKADSRLQIYVVPINKGTLPLKILVNGIELETNEENLSALVPPELIQDNLNVQLKNPITQMVSENFSLILKGEESN